jgi:hypothetical protein
MLPARPADGEPAAAGVVGNPLVLARLGEIREARIGPFERRVERRHGRAHVDGGAGRGSRRQGRADRESSDTLNVNPIALARVDRLFCRNERAVLRARLKAGGDPIAIVTVAANLVASIRLHFLDVLLHPRYRGPHESPCAAPFSKGQKWAGSSTTRPSWCSRRAASRCVKASAPAHGCESERRCCVCPERAPGSGFIDSSSSVVNLDG